MQYFDVYVDGMKDLYTYSDNKNEFTLGETVIVPFQRKKKTAIIIRKNENENFNFKVFNIISKIKNGIVLKESQLKLIEWLASYYLASYDSIIKTVIPKNVKIKYKQNYLLNIENKELIKYLDNKIIKFLFSEMKMSYSTAKKKLKKSVIDTLIVKGFLRLEEKIVFLQDYSFQNFYKENFEIFQKFYEKSIIEIEKLENQFSKAEVKKILDLALLKIDVELNDKKEFLLERLEDIKKAESLLTDEQVAIKNEIEKSTDKYFLLKGITGSGKTEIYIELIKEAFFKGEGSIFLVPEISLTPQMINKFKKEFQNNIAILHSRLTDNERAREWESLYKGEKKIVLGVRSAIFSPVQNLKYIILDEEHETTYKQDSTPRYNAKYVAIKRVLVENTKLILGSATPSIESYYYAKEGIYKLLTLNTRFGQAKMPLVEIVDMKQEEDLFFSKKLLQEIKNTLLRNEQVILLLNRKGYSTYIQCKDCGQVEECVHCSIKMTYFQGEKILKCNYCGKIKKYENKCSHCGSTNLIHGGKGIERVEEELKKYFDVPIIKVDGDYSKDREFFSNMYKDFLDKKYSILIGTQIVAKGLHFPDVTLVGVINADIILNFPDFRSGEKTFQLLTQVSGRAGRAKKEGKVIIQSYQPENYVIENSREELYDLFYETEINARKMFFYPPFSKLINIGLSSESEEKLQKESKNIFNLIRSENIEIYGPMPSMVYKVKDKYRMNIFIKGNKKNIDIYKRKLVTKLREINNSKVRITVDIDPINLL